MSSPALPVMLALVQMAFANDTVIEPVTATAPSSPASGIESPMYEILTSVVPVNGEANVFADEPDACPRCDASMTSSPERLTEMFVTSPPEMPGAVTLVVCALVAIFLPYASGSVICLKVTSKRATSLTAAVALDDVHTP
jgi:hypothetical protein